MLHRRMRLLGLTLLLAALASPARGADTSPATVDPKTGEGCWVRFFGEPDFRQPIGRLAGGMYIYSIEKPGLIGKRSEEKFLKDARSAIVGPEATLRAYSEPGFDKELIVLEPQRKVQDLRALGFPARIASLKITCK
jgi:hypothetical protein